MRALMAIGLIIGCATVLMAGQDAADPHVAVNSLYAELISKGVAAQGGKTLSLPTPVVTEAMDAKAQHLALKQLAGDDYPLEEVLRTSVVAPHIYKFRDFPRLDDDRMPHAIDLWFVAHGDMDKLTSKNLQSLFTSTRKDTQVTTLSEDDLKTRGLTSVVKADYEESFVYAVQPILERVQMEGTNRTVFSRKPGSLVLASRLDPRFGTDAKFANRWRSLVIDADGGKKVGAAQPYEGAAAYVRMTRLREPANAILVEFHQVFIEHKKWFDGANLLRSKLPLVIQAEVRAFRRELTKLSS